MILRQEIDVRYKVRGLNDTEKIKNIREKRKKIKEHTKKNEKDTQKKRKETKKEIDTKKSRDHVGRSVCDIRARLCVLITSVNNNAIALYVSHPPILPLFFNDAVCFLLISRWFVLFPRTKSTNDDDDGDDDDFINAAKRFIYLLYIANRICNNVVI